MNFLKKYFGDLFFSAFFYYALAGCMLLFIASFYLPALFAISVFAFFGLLILALADYSFLFFTRKHPSATRISAGRMSNGDQNRIEIIVKNDFSFPVMIRVIDELPEQFQDRGWVRTLQLEGRQQRRIRYFLRPLQRGAYEFGDIHLFTSTPLRLISRRFTSPAREIIPVYPAFLQLFKYEIFSNAIIQGEAGSRRMRKIGQSMEFEQIKEYVTGDDIRNINWKAAARRGTLMVNNFMDERSQQVYCIIDKGRLMKMPFDGLTLLDYAINSTLVLSDICLKKQDRVGVITFSNALGSILAADRKPVQKQYILQLLYNQSTDFLESDFEMLYMQVRNHIRHRSLLILFTNFESLSGLNRQLEYLRSIASHHLLLVIFFENTELHALSAQPARSVEDVYVKTVAGKFDFEKRLIAKELQKCGILTLLTPPQKLTVNAINKYLELKTRQAI